MHRAWLARGRPVPLRGMGVLTLLCLAAGASRMAAQPTPRGDSAAATAPPPAAPPAARRILGDAPFFTVWVAAARRAAFSTRRGTRLHDLYLMGMRTGWTIANRATFSLDYVVSAIPLAVMTGNPEYGRAVPAPCLAQAVCAQRAAVRGVATYHSVYGFGVAPLGVQLRLFRHTPVHLLLHVNGGVLWFARPVPDPRATHLNFTAESGVEVQWWFSRRNALAVGYALHHTSNAATGDVNPGLNSGMITLGLTRRPR